MLSALYVEISAIGIMLLVIILVTQRRTTGFSATQRRFNNLIYTLIVMLVIDAGCWLIDGAQFLFARELNYILETLYYCLQIFLPFLWALYVEYSLSSDLKSARKRIPNVGKADPSDRRTREHFTRAGHDMEACHDDSSLPV